MAQIKAVFVGLVLWIICNLIQANDGQPGAGWGIRSRHWPFIYSVDPNDISFYLYSNPANEDFREKIDISNSTALSQTSYDTSKPLIILIHGWMGSPSTLTDVMTIKNAYLSVNYEANIVMVDHKALANTNLPSVPIPYANAVASLPTLLNTFRTGRRVADFVKFLINEKALKGPEQVHMIGLGNGACIAGHAGDTVQKTLQGAPKIGRISGLDPLAGSIYPGGMIDSSDASFVDITYTALGFTGAIGRTGHVDFYVNGGRPNQPTCRNVVPYTEPYCSHFSSVFYFAKSVRNKNMVGCRCTQNCRKPPVDCNEKIVYGQYMPLNARGDYYVGVKNYE